MRRVTRRIAPLLALGLISAYAVARALGADEHVRVLVGMAARDTSYVVGPLFVALHLAAILVAPPLLLAAAADAALALVRHRRTRAQPGLAPLANQAVIFHPRRPPGGGSTER